MIVNCSEIEIILNELLARNKKEISLLSIFGSEILFNYNLEEQKLYLKTTRNNWNDFIEVISNKHQLSKKAITELPTYDDIVQAVKSSGLLKPDGIDDLIQEIKNYLSPKKRMNRRKRFIIALDTNLLMDNLMSCYIEKEFLSYENQVVRNFITYVISSWVLHERDNFIKTEKNRGVRELNEKFGSISFYMPEKKDRLARKGYSIFSEMKNLEESYDLLESKLDIKRKNEIINDKDQKDQAIIDEYEDYKKTLKDVKIIFVTSDDQAFGQSDSRLDSILIEVPRFISNKINCSFENGAKLIYQLTLFFGYLRINNYNIRFDINYPKKRQNDWKVRKLNFTCLDNSFNERVENLIKTTRKLEEII